MIRYDNQQVTAEILDAIRQFDGIPSRSSLAKALIYSQRFVMYFIDANPGLAQALEEQGLKYINGLTPERLKEETAKSNGLTAVCCDSPKLLARLHERIDNEVVLPEITRFEGVQVPSSLSEMTPYSEKFITQRINANSKLAQALEEQGLKYINGLTVEELKKEIGRPGGLTSRCKGHQRLQTRLHERIDDEILLPAIKELGGIVLPHYLPIIVQFTPPLIEERIRANPTLARAVEKQGLEYINDLSLEELKKETAKTNGLTLICRDHPKLLARLHERIDEEMLLPEIVKSNGVPTPTSLSRVLPYNDMTIRRRISANPKLTQALEEQGLKYINGLTQERLKEETTRKGGLGTLCKSHPKLLARLHERIDEEMLLPEIKKFEGVPTPESLSRILPHSVSFIRLRIEENPLLFAAMAEKQGLTLDQAVELALGRSKDINALNSIMSEQLKNLYAFREMLGIFRIFSDLFEKAKHILETSLYPAPLGKAMELDGAPRITCYANPRRDLDNVSGKYDLVVLQGIHRLSQEDFNKLLFEIRGSLPAGCSVIATYSDEYGMIEGMPEALRHAGFELQESGIIEINAPDELPCDANDAERLRRKLSGQSNVLHMTVLENSEAVAQVPNVTKLNDSAAPKEGRGTEGKDIIVPNEALKGLHTRFTQNIALVSMPSEPILLTITGDSDEPLAVIGFDMNSVRPRTTEVRRYPNSESQCKAVNLRQFARDLARNAILRTKLGVVPGHEARINIGRISA